MATAKPKTTNAKFEYFIVYTGSTEHRAENNPSAVLHNLHHRYLPPKTIGKHIYARARRKDQCGIARTRFGEVVLAPPSNRTWCMETKGGTGVEKFAEKLVPGLFPTVNLVPGVFPARAKIGAGFISYSLRQKLVPGLFPTKNWCRGFFLPAPNK